MILNCNQFGNPQGHALVFLHGFMGRAESFDIIIKSLSKKYFCIAFDLPGHGKSLFRTSPILGTLNKFSQVSQIILSDLDELGIHRFYLYGYSMGGRVAQCVLLRAKQRVKKLILESAGFGIQDHVQRHIRYEEDLNLFRQINDATDFRKFLEKWYSASLFSTLTKTSTYQEIIESRLNNTPEELKKALKLLSIGTQKDQLIPLSKLNTPIFYLYGEQDTKYKAIAKQAAEIISTIKLLPIQHASHNIHAQLPEHIINGIHSVVSHQNEIGP